MLGGIYVNKHNYNYVHVHIHVCTDTICTDTTIIKEPDFEKNDHFVYFLQYGPKYYQGHEIRTLQ